MPRKIPIDWQAGVDLLLNSPNGVDSNQLAEATHVYGGQFTETFQKLLTEQNLELVKEKRPGRLGNLYRVRRTDVKQD